MPLLLVSKLPTLQAPRPCPARRGCILLVCLLATPALATDVVLREQAIVAGPVLLLGDLADVQSADPRQVFALTNTPLGPTPRARHYLRTGEIRDLLRARGVDPGTIQFRGSAAVEIRSAHVAVEPHETAARPVDRKRIGEQLEAAIQQFLAGETGHDLWHVELASRGIALDRFDEADPAVALQVAGGAAPWTGRQRFSVNLPGQEESVAVDARVRRIEMVAYAAEPIEAGRLIRASQIELRPHVGTPPTQAVHSIEGAAGKVARRAIRPDMLLSTSMLRAPLLVRRNETVSVYARTGGVTVRTFAIAKQDGALGDLIQVESGESRQRYAARVSGRRELEVYATGAGVNDYALRAARQAAR